MKKFVIKCVKVFLEAGIAALLAMLGISSNGCVNPNFAKVIHEHCK